MLLSVSRRTDIPAHYAPWFYNRLQAGFVLVRNPRNPHAVSKISLSPDVVDGIVFWTKNPVPMLGRLDALRAYPFVFQFTLTPYGPDVEPGLPAKREVLLPAFRELSRRLGPARVLWRYDPIFLSPRYTEAFHLRAFAALAKALSPYTEVCTLSFLDVYRGIRHRLAPLQAAPCPPDAQRRLAEGFSEIAKRYGLRLQTCAEEIDLSAYGIEHGHCVDGALFSRLLGCPLAVRKDPNQRPACGCAESIDIGAYDTCRSGCVYCYATASAASAANHASLHDPDSPLLWGHPSEADTVKTRAMRACAQRQLSWDLSSL